LGRSTVFERGSNARGAARIRRGKCSIRPAWGPSRARGQRAARRRSHAQNRYNSRCFIARRLRGAPKIDHAHG
jgi:hypothetical protein